MATPAHGHGHPAGNGSRSNGSGRGACVIEVSPKYGNPDPAGAALLSQVQLLGIAACRDLRVSSLYEIAGRYTQAQLHQIARDLLTDPVTQEYRLDGSASSPAFLLGPHWRIEVWPKPSVTDPAAESVLKAVCDLGLSAPESVRTGSAYRLLGRLAPAQAERVATKLLANPVIHRTNVQQL